MATKGDLTGLDVLTFGGQPLVPSVAVGGFGRYKKSGVVRSNNSGGASRQRRKYFGTTHIANVTFYLETAAHQDFFEMFVERNQGKRFICHLQADRPIVEPYVVQITSEVQFSEVNAISSQASMEMEIYSVRDREVDDLMFTLYSSIGVEAMALFVYLHDIVELMPTP